MSEFQPVDALVLVVYLAGVTAWGAWLGRGQTGGKDYFLGGRDLPWGAVLLSIVATETSTLTFLSVPGVSYLGTLEFLQLTGGYLIGRIVVALVLLPAYARGDIETAYGLLEARFGPPARRFTSGIFMITRMLADSVRLFATAIPLALVTGWPYWQSIVAIGVLTLAYTYVGGIRAVVWVDALQMMLYLVGGIIAAIALGNAVSGGWGEILAQANAAEKLRLVDFSFDLSKPYTIWAGFLGGAVFTMASHGTDQLLVQRLLTTRDTSSAQKALIGSGFAVIVQFALFLLIGIGLWVHYGGRAFDSSDAIFATFVVEGLPPGVTGLLLAGVFAAAMSSLSSSINSLASASAYDFWAPLTGVHDDALVLRAGKRFTLVWAALLIGGAILFIPMSSGNTAIEVALAVASLVYGGLLGAFALALYGGRADTRSVIIGIATGVATVTFIWLFARSAVAWPWFVPIGATVTFVVGRLLGRATPRVSGEP